MTWFHRKKGAQNVKNYNFTIENEGTGGKNDSSTIKILGHNYLAKFPVGIQRGTLAYQAYDALIKLAAKDAGGPNFKGRDVRDSDIEIKVQISLKENKK